MHLSRLILNPRSHQVQRDVGNSYELHRTVMSAFPDTLPADERVLYRLEQHPQAAWLTLLVQSRHVVEWRALLQKDPAYVAPADALPWEMRAIEQKQVALQLRVGQTLQFRLRANPTVKKKVDGKKNGKRLGLFQEAAQLEWLTRKLEAGGFQMMGARVSQDEWVTGKRPTETGRQALKHFGVLFEGMVQVTDATLALQTVQNGVGSGKGLGFGLLSLARI